MHRSKWIILLCLALIFRACVDPYEPTIDEEKELLVIDGILNDRDSLQTISISLSSPYNSPEFIPVQGCIVRVEDNLGTGLLFLETEAGTYQVETDPNFAIPGRAYKLTVSTPSGEVYESSYDTLMPCPPISNLDYEVEVQGTSDPDTDYYGIRFYLDMKGSSTDSKSFMWMYEETWEYHAYYPIQYVWDGEILHDYTPELAGYKVCYLSNRLNEYQVGSSEHLVSNEIINQPIHFVSNQSPRLEEKYSLLVLQHSLSDGAYDYLVRLRSQSGESGGLYETQPASAQGNIYNVNKPGEKVLGYFFTSQIKEKRILVEEEFDFKMKYFYCPIDTVWSTDEFEDELPYFMYSANVDGEGPPYEYSYQECFNCLYRGGTNEKPDYWENKE